MTRTTGIDGFSAGLKKLYSFATFVRPSFCVSTGAPGLYSNPGAPDPGTDLPFDRQALAYGFTGVPIEQVAALEAMLAEQVAAGGQDCGAARRLLVMREKLRAEQREQEQRAASLKERT